jgi:predicted MPP superfamily phosphohydrolase
MFLAAAMLVIVIWRKQRTSMFLLLVATIYFCIGTALVFARIYATQIEPHRLVLREVSFKSTKLEQPLRILHISDIQSDQIGRYELEAFRRMQDLHPDIIIYTGDLLQPLPQTCFESELSKIMDLFRQLHPSLGIYGVYGGIDEPLRRVPGNMLGELHMLENAEVSILWDETKIRLFGLSDCSARSPQEAAMLVRNWLAGSGPADISILFGHSPDYAVAIQDFLLDLCLAGHTHGGQIRIPFVGPLVTLTEHIPRSWAVGYREIGKTRLNVSAGIGSEHAGGLPCIRVNCPSEMTLIVIKPEGSELDDENPSAAADADKPRR